VRRTTSRDTVIAERITTIRLLVRTLSLIRSVHAVMLVGQHLALHGYIRPAIAKQGEDDENAGARGGFLWDAVLQCGSRPPRAGTPRDRRLHHIGANALVAAAILVGRECYRAGGCRGVVVVVGADHWVGRRVTSSSSAKRGHEGAKREGKRRRKNRYHADAGRAVTHDYRLSQHSREF